MDEKLKTEMDALIKHNRFDVIEDRVSKLRKRLDDTEKLEYAVVQLGERLVELERRIQLLEGEAVMSTPKDDDACMGSYFDEWCNRWDEYAAMDDDAKFERFVSLLPQMIRDDVRSKCGQKSPGHRFVVSGAGAGAWGILSMNGTYTSLFTLTSGQSGCHIKPSWMTYLSLAMPWHDYNDVLGYLHRGWNPRK